MFNKVAFYFRQYKNIYRLTKINILLFFILLGGVFLLFPITSHFESQILLSKNELRFSDDRVAAEGAFKQWEAGDREQGGPNSFVTINYDKCIPIAQCRFNDCKISGSNDGNGNYCLPVAYSQIGDWVPSIEVDIFGISLLKNPLVYSVPVEHTQASARLPDANGNAYFMFSNSQNYFGFIWVVEVQGIDLQQPQHLSSSMPARVVWWQKLNKCKTMPQCNDPLNPGNFNHPARISTVDNMVAIAFQNYSYTLQGKIKLSQISSVFRNASIRVPKSLQVSILPRYPKIRSADAVAFYDVSNPKNPIFTRKLVGDQSALWGGQPPGRDISEVAIANMGEFYLMNVGGTLRNIDGNGTDKIFGTNYKIVSGNSVGEIVPLFSRFNANIFANFRNEDSFNPINVFLNSVPMYIKDQGILQYGLSLQLIAKPMIYQKIASRVSKNKMDDVIQEKELILTARLIYGEISQENRIFEHQFLEDLQWKSEACERAWGFQVLSNGGYNIVCHDANPRGSEISNQGRFLVRGVSPSFNGKT